MTALKRGWCVPLMLVVLTGCNAHEAPTVSWYLEHTEERRLKVAWCADDFQRQGLAECLNAVAADNQRRMGQMKDLPPIDWNAGRKTP